LLAGASRCARRASLLPQERLDAFKSKLDAEQQLSQLSRTVHKKGAV
jgi:hypothetical protein